MFADARCSARTPATSPPLYGDYPGLAACAGTLLLAQFGFAQAQGSIVNSTKSNTKDYRQGSEPPRETEPGAERSGASRKKPEFKTLSPASCRCRKKMPFLLSKRSPPYDKAASVGGLFQPPPCGRALANHGHAIPSQLRLQGSDGFRGWRSIYDPGQDSSLVRPGKRGGPCFSARSAFFMCWLVAFAP
jgi:hypothetical protein